VDLFSTLSSVEALLKGREGVKTPSKR